MNQEKVEQDNQENKFIVNWIKTIFMIVFSSIIVFGNFFLEHSFAQDEKEKTEQDFSSLNYEKIYNFPERGILRFDDEKDNSLEIKELNDKEYLINMEEGRIWGNFYVSNVNLNILVDRVVVMPNNAVFELKKENNFFELAVYKGDVYLGFLEEGILLKDLQDSYSLLFMNRLLVPHESMVSFSLNQITNEIEPLLYSKLVKELRLSNLSSTKKDDDWVKNNLSSDREFFLFEKKDFLSEVLLKGISKKDTTLSNFIFWMEENLIFFPHKQEQVLIKHIFDYLNDALFYANERDLGKMNSSLNYFDESFDLISDELKNRAEFKKILNDFIEKLFVFNSNDTQYFVLEFLLNNKIEQENLSVEEVVDVLNIFWRNIYSVLNEGNVFAEEALKNYYKYFDKFLNQLMEDENFYHIFITYQNQLMDNLFIKYPVFYKEEYLAIKYALEENLLKLYNEGRLKNELKQSFIDNKIRFLRRLRILFFEGEISVLDAKDAFKRLFAEIDEFMPEDTKVAVLTFFETRLADMDDFWGYLSSPEYHTGIYGLNHKVRYENYLEERETIWSFISMQEVILGELVDEEKTVEEVLLEIENIFRENSNISEINVEEFTNISQRYVNVKGVFAGYPFEAKYDRYSDTISDIYIYEELISMSPLKLDSLLDVIYSKFDVITELREILTEEEITLETSAQRYARLFIMNKVKEFGFELELDDVFVENEEKVIYRVKNVKVPDYRDLELIFDILMTEELVTNIYILVDGKPSVFAGKYSLLELKELVIAEYQRIKGIVPEVREEEEERTVDTIFSPVGR